MKLFHYAFIGIAVYFAACSYIIVTGLDSIKRSSYNIGCMSVPKATFTDIELCKASFGKERIRYERTV